MQHHTAPFRGSVSMKTPKKEKWGDCFAYADETSSIRQNRVRPSHVISLTDDPFVPISQLKISQRRKKKKCMVSRPHFKTIGFRPTTRISPFEAIVHTTTHITGFGRHAARDVCDAPRPAAARARLAPDTAAAVHEHLVLDTTTSRTRSPALLPLTHLRACTSGIPWHILLRMATLRSV